MRSEKKKKRVAHRSLTEYARKNIREIHKLSVKYNGRKKSHAAKLLKMAKEHAEEISALYRKKDPHFTVEVGDLLVLCQELLLEQKKDPDKVLDICYGRFKKKLSDLVLKRNNAKRGTQ